MVDIIAFGAHPDDVEFGCGGIIAKMASEGKRVLIVDLTLGDKASNGSAEVRRQEGIEAARILGAERICLDFKDCEIFDTYENRLKLVQVLREHRPELVLAPLWKGESNHPDHIAAGQMIRYACRYARFKSILPELPVHHVGGVLHYLHHLHGVPDFYIDISAFVDQWKASIEAHKSQMQTLPYLDWNLRVASANGVFAGADYAQGLVKGNPVIIENLMELANQVREL